MEKDQTQNPIWMGGPKYRVVEQTDERGLENTVEIGGIKFTSKSAGRRMLSVPVTRVGVPPQVTSLAKKGENSFIDAA